MPASAAGPSGTTSDRRKRPFVSYSERSKSSARRPSVVWPEVGGGEIPMCEAFRSPSISEMTRRMSSPVRAPATRGSYVARSGHCHGLWLSLLERHGENAPAIQVIDVLAVRCEVRAPLAARRRGELL